MANKYRDVNQAGIDLIKRFEGCRLKAYKLKGEKYYTIGYGHSFDDNITADTVWTQEQCEENLRNDLDKYEGYVVKTVTNITVNDNQFGALVSYCYNRGLGKEDGSNGLKQLVKNSNTVQEYADNIVKYWGTATRYKNGLIQRRNAEKALFLTGHLHTETAPQEKASLNRLEIMNNIVIIQKWLNKEYGEYLEQCDLCGCKILTVDGRMGNKTRAGLTIALQVYLNGLGENLVIDGDYGTKTNATVKKLIAVKHGTTDLGSKIVQAILYCYGYNPQAFNEKFDINSVAALKLCQADHNLNVDGVAGVIFFTTLLIQR